MLNQIRLAGVHRSSTHWSAIPKERADFNSGGPRLLHGVSLVRPWVKAENFKTESREAESA
jgi:hypothetical protein